MQPRMEAGIEAAQAVLPGADGRPGPAAEVDRRVGRAVVLAFAGTIAVAGVVWGSIYLVLGTPGAAVYPYAFRCRRSSTP